MANPEWTEPEDWNDKEDDMERAELGIDGNCGFALVGPDLQIGEAEFEAIGHGYVSGPLDTLQYHAAKAAINRAYQRLKTRIGRPISYYLGDSHPDAC